MLRARVRWLWPTVALALLPGAAGGAEAVDPRAARLREEAAALIPSDDAASLQRAVELLDEAARVDPRLYPARADRALVEVLVAAARRDEATRLPSGEELMQGGRELREQALDELRPLVREHPRDPAVARALAVYYGLEGDAAQTARLAGEVRAAGGPDPWIDFAVLAGRVRGEGPEAAVPELAAFVAAQPRMMRARMMLAVAQLGISRSDALATVDELLALNPDHDGARHLKAILLAPPPAHLVVLPTPRSAPPPQPSGLLPRRPGR